MSELTEAEGYLIEQIRRGDAEGWRQLVSRYQGRLVAFARNRLRRPADAEDLVQDTFLGFLNGLPNYRGQAGIETYLFTILRHKIINWGRGQHADLRPLDGDTTNRAGTGTPVPSPDILFGLASDDPTASWYVRRDEAHEHQRTLLTAAIRRFAGDLKESGNLRDLQVVEMLFYCGLPNKDVAAALSLNEGHIALIKHRAIRRIRTLVAPGSSEGDGPPDEPPSEPDADDFSLVDTTISDIWKILRPSCPKRSTLGAHLLGTLDAPWHEYVSFHLDRLSCEFCRANYQDLQRQTAEGDTQVQVLRDRIVQSTVGFLSNPSADASHR